MAAEDLTSANCFKMGYRPALDGLRAVAALLVVSYHVIVIIAPVPGLDEPGGYMGVDIFFVLSGFLITSLLLQEKYSGHISIRKFYVRRSLRLMPALFILILFQIAYVFYSGGNIKNDIEELVPVALYFYNWWAVFEGPTAFGMSHTWSLAVEEQFYFVWPLLLIGLLHLDSRFWMLTGMLLLFLAGVISRALIFPHFTFVAVYWQTESHVDELMLGAMAATFVSWGWKPGKWIYSAAWIGTALIAWMVGVSGREGILMWQFGGVDIVALGIVAIILAVLEPRGLLYKVLAWAPMRFVGRISYSLYLWHVLILFAVANSLPNLNAIEKTIYIVLGSIVCAVTSFYAIEQPFGKLKAIYN